jgi:hypothetical protein
MLLYFINGIAFISNRYITKILIKTEIALTNDDCSKLCKINCLRNCDHCNPCSKTKKLEVYLENIPQEKKENYYDLGIIDYPTIYLIIVSIFNIFGIIFNIIFSLLYIIIFNIFDQINRSKILLPLLILISFFACVFCYVSCLNKLYEDDISNNNLLNDETNRDTTDNKLNEEKNNIENGNEEYNNIEYGQNLYTYEKIN